MHALRGMLVGLTIAGGLALAAAEPPPPPHSRSPRNASYRIDVSLDTETHQLEGRQVLSWRNIQQEPTSELWFHLYWNGWRNDRSSWLLEDRMRRRSDMNRDKVREQDWGWIIVDQVRLLSNRSTIAGGSPSVFRDERETGAPLQSPDVQDLTDTKRYVAPDDGNPWDRTVLVVDLPEPVEPGATVDVELTWRAKIPRTFARTGYRGDYYFIAHWFPKLGVYEAGGWNCHQYHATTEYYSDYGVYDVRLTVPTENVVGATGREITRIDNGDGTTTHQYREADVHGFAWTTSPHYLERTATFEEPGLPRVDMRLLIQSEHLRQADRHFEATRKALESYGRWYGPYPYGHVTVIDPAYGSGAGGMEYPTLFTCGTRLFNPLGGDSPESVTIHEAGHQFWYGLVGNNEFEHAWIDEGFNTYSTLRTLDTTYPPRQYVRRYLPQPRRSRRSSGFLPVTFPDIVVDRWSERHRRYRESAFSDAPEQATFRYHPATAGNISYSKTALWLRTLEKYYGWPKLQAVMSTFFERYRFYHPDPRDFFDVAEEVIGEDLSWFFDQVHYDSVVFDYAVDSVASVPIEPKGFVEEPDGMSYRDRKQDEDSAEDSAEDSEQAKSFRSEVVVQRRGGGVFPVDVLLVFEDGYEMREKWDGREHWKLITAERPSKLRYAVVDPEHVLMLDLYPANNGRMRESSARLPAAKWSSKWMIWLQDLMAGMAFFM